MSGFVPKVDTRTVRRALIQHREPHVPLIAATGATSALNLRAEGCNCSNYQQPEWNYPDARYCLQDQPRQKQPLPAQHAEQQAAVTTSIAHTIGGAKLAKAPMTSDTPAMTKATASRDTENLRGLEAAEGSDILI
jgi:hypothetical protein